MPRLLVTVLIAASVLASLTTGGVGLLLAWACFRGGLRDRAFAGLIAVLSLSLLAAPLSAWLIIPQTRLGLRATLAAVALCLSLVLLRFAVSGVEAAARP